MTLNLLPELDRASLSYGLKFRIIFILAREYVALECQFFRPNVVISYISSRNNTVKVLFPPTWDSP